MAQMAWNIKYIYIYNKMNDPKMFHLRARYNVLCGDIFKLICGITNIFQQCAVLTGCVLVSKQANQGQNVGFHSIILTNRAKYK